MADVQFYYDQITAAQKAGLPVTLRDLSGMAQAFRADGYRDALRPIETLAEQWEERARLAQHAANVSGTPAWVEAAQEHADTYAKFAEELRAALATGAAERVRAEACGHPNHGSDDHDCRPFANGGNR